MGERRSSNRSRTILGGLILSRSGTRLTGCTVLDLSDSGARILLDEDCALPGEFTLEIPRRGLTRLAHAIWADGRSHGIAFVQDCIPARALDCYEVRKIVEEARKRIAELLGLSPERVEVDVRIDG